MRARIVNLNYKDHRRNIKKVKRIIAKNNEFGVE